MIPLKRFLHEEGRAEKPNLIQDSYFLEPLNHLLSALLRDRIQTVISALDLQILNWKAIPLPDLISDPGIRPPINIVGGTLQEKDRTRDGFQVVDRGAPDEILEKIKAEWDPEHFRRFAT